MYEVKLDLNASLEDAKRPTVVVCSSEVHKLPGLISLLKHRLGLAVRSERFEGATLLISPRMAVDRMMISDFCNGSNKKRVVESCQVGADRWLLLLTSIIMNKLFTLTH